MPSRKKAKAKRPPTPRRQIQKASRKRGLRFKHINPLRAYVLNCAQQAVDFMEVIDLAQAGMSVERQPIPRLVPTRVGTFETKMQVTLPYGSSIADQNDPRRGLGGIQLHPNAIRPGSHLEFVPLTAPCTVLNVIANEINNSAVQGLWPVGPGLQNEAVTGPELSIDDASFVNLVGMVSYSNETESQGRTLSSALDADGNQFYGMMVDLGTGADVVITYSLSCPTVFPVGFILTVQLASTIGLIQASSVALGSAANTINGSLTFVGGVAALGGRYACCTPNKPLGMRIKSNSAIAINRAGLGFAQAASTTLMRWKYLTPNTAATVALLYTKTAVVGGGIFASYMGNTLQNGGVSSYTLYRGGSSALLEGCNGVEPIAAMVEGISAPLKAGHYAPWQPSSLEDLEFYPIRDVDQSLSLTTCCAYWQVADPTQLNAIRVYLVTLNEGITTNPMVKTSMAPAIPGGTAEYVSIMSQFPTRVDNPLHWGDIKSFAKKIWSVGSHAYGFYKDNSHWINPMLGAIGAALI